MKCDKCSKDATYKLKNNDNTSLYLCGFHFVVKSHEYGMKCYTKDNPLYKIMPIERCRWGCNGKLKDEDDFYDQ